LYLSQWQTFVCPTNLAIIRDAHANKDIPFAIASRPGLEKARQCAGVFIARDFRQITFDIFCSHKFHDTTRFT
jgi:hypothetical protein